ncbi:MAG: hypothetical protein JWP31_435, partial [Aeromicrobium sp.]|nr:hypothetical protein [Aeromicrobium sp.]
RLVILALAALPLGLAAGLTWLWLAEPARWEVRSNGIVLTEAAAKGQFSVVVTFIAIGAVVSLAWALCSALVLRDTGWVTTPFVIVLTVVAAVIAWGVGVTLGPPDPASVTGTSIGDRIPSSLGVDVAAFLAWPLAGLVGLLIGTWATALRDESHDDQDAEGPLGR